MTFDSIVERFSARRNGSGWLARCPAHEDAKASLSIAPGDDGRTLLHCHAGCSTSAVVAACGLTMADLQPERTRGGKPQIIATYDYTDEHKTLLYQVVRFSPKDFRQRRPDGVGAWIWKLGRVRRVLFGLPELRDQKGAYIVEGEKDVLALRAIGLSATTNAGGAGKWRDDYTRQLQAAGTESVAILPDNDEAGRQHAETVARSCYAAGLTVKIIALPDVPAKSDVSDFLATHSGDELVALVNGAKPYGVPLALAKADAAPAPKREKPEKLKQGRGVQLEDPEPWAEPVDGAMLLDTIATTFTRYVALPAHASTALALWVLHTYAFAAWFTSPFLAITSPAKRCGKTLLLIVLGAVVPRRLFASSVTAAVLFRTIEKYAPTLLIDEADTFIRDNAELRGVLNSGHTRTTAVVIRAVGEDFDPRAFSTWCAKAVALIGRLPDTLADRAIEIAMRRRTAGERVERLRQDRIESECSDLRRQAARWAADHLPKLQNADPAVPAALHDRAADCWRPLLAVADDAGGEWPARARDAAKAISRSEDETDQSAAVLVLADVRTIFGPKEELSSADIVNALRALDSRPWASWGNDNKGLTTHALARLLKGFGIHPVKIRFGSQTANGYTWRMFGDAWTRYTPVEPEQQNNPNVCGPETAFSQPEHSKSCSRSEMQVSPMNTGLCSSVPAQTPDRQEDASVDHPDLLWREAGAQEDDDYARPFDEP